MGAVRKINLDAPQIAYLCDRDSQLDWLISKMGVLEYSSPENPFRFIIEEIIGQMLSNKAADAISSRLDALCSGNICAETLNGLSIHEMSSIGISKSKCEYIKCFASAVASGDLVLENLACLSDEDVIAELMRIRGIGIWTSKMYLLFVLERDNVIPSEDTAFLRAFQWLYGFPQRPSFGQIMEICECWKPYSSYAARYLYKALDSGLTKETIMRQK